MKHILYLAAALLLAGGCKKNDDQPDRTPLLTGNWDATFRGYDINRNSILDDEETREAIPTYALDFRADGTGSITDSAYNGNFTWKFTDNQQFLELNDLQASPVRFEVRSLSEQDMLLIEFRNSYDYFMLFHKN